MQTFRIATRTRHIYFEQRLEARIQMHNWFLYQNTQNCVKSCIMWWVDTTLLESGCIYILFNFFCCKSFYSRLAFKMRICQTGNSTTIRLVFIQENCVVIRIHLMHFQSTHPICNASYISCIVLLLKKSPVKVLSWMFSKYYLLCPYIELVVGTPQCFRKSNATLVFQ